jgi:drug/metabolite transporter (DMT)-like permease
MTIYEVIFLTLLAALVTSFAQFLFKKSVTKIDSIRHLLLLVKNKGVMLGLACYAIGFVIYITALSGGELSIVFPIFASSFIFVTIISAVTLKEKITMMRAAGVLLVFIGITIVAIS